MKNLFANSIIAAILLIFISSCNNVTGPAEDFSFTGKIIHEDGIPVTEVKIHFIYSLTDVPLKNNPNPFEIMPSTVIKFSLPSQSDVTIVILNYTRTDTIAVLHYPKSQPGSHSVTWDSKNRDGKNITNGVYIYELITETFKNEHYMLLNSSDISYLTNAAYYYFSDQNGKFGFPYSDQPFDVEFIRTGEADPTPIGKSKINCQLFFVLIKDGYETLIEKIELDLSKNFSWNFIMKAAD
jgi:hypothetical protein